MFVQEKIIARFDDAKGDFEVEIPKTRLDIKNFDAKKLGDYIHSVVKKKAGMRMKDFLGYKVESKNPHINAYVKVISDANRTEVEESLMSTMYNKLIKTVRKMPKDQFVRKYVGTHMFPGADKMSKNDLEDIQNQCSNEHWLAMRVQYERLQQVMYQYQSNKEQHST